MVRPLAGSPKLRSSTPPTFRVLEIGSLAKSKRMARFTFVLVATLPNRGNFVIRIPRTFYEYVKRLEGRTEWKDEIWAAFAFVRKATDQLTEQDLRAHLFDSTVLPALGYAAETWADTAATSRKLLTTHRVLEKCLLKLSRRTQHLAGLCSSDLRGISPLRDPAVYILKAKHRWALHIMRRMDDKRPRGRPPTRWVTYSLHEWSSEELSWIRLKDHVNVIWHSFPSFL
ncbi:hypothetical protein RB195_024278 [Necator americanus]|uniref:Uncharacterized protein n=1 Tax=Necator americanus TaxID=51031 RepID=A0ABR1EMK1_NECAM